MAEIHTSLWRGKGHIHRSSFIQNGHFTRLLFDHFELYSWQLPHIYISNVRNDKNKILHKNSKRLCQHLRYLVEWTSSRETIHLSESWHLKSKLISAASVAEVTFIQTYWLVIDLLYQIPNSKLWQSSHSFRLSAQFPIPIQLWESSFTFIETHWLVIVVLYDRPRHPASAQTLVQRWKAAAKKKETAMNDRINTIFCHWDEWPNYRNVLPLHDFMPPQWMTKLKRFLCHRMILCHRNEWPN